MEPAHETASRELERRFAKVLAVFRRHRAAKPRTRPFVVELFGTPKAGKTTMKDMIKHFGKRNDWNVTAPTEGAEMIETPRDTPLYNIETRNYAMSALHARIAVAHPEADLVILDRGPYDGIMWLDYWTRKGKLSAEDHATIEAYYRLPMFLDQFDAHLCMVCEPKLALIREVAHTVSTKDGDTMNPKSLETLFDAHRKMWERFDCDKDPRMSWHDSSSEDVHTTSLRILDLLATAFERRIKTL